MDKGIEFAISLAAQIEEFEKENNVKVNIVRWGIGVTEQGEISWGDENERHISIEYRDLKEN